MILAAAEVAGRLDANRPWPGLDPFPEEARAFFYGRGQECDELFRCIRRDVATLLFGQSGLGKTSLLQAGLFPLLRRNGFLPVRVRLDYGSAAIPPAAQMLATLQQALAEAKLAKWTPLQPNQRLWAYFHRTDLELVAADGATITPVLGFDQFEEAFTLGLAREGVRERAQEFLSELADLIENRPSEDLEARFAESPHLVEEYDFDRQSYRIVIVLREDYLAALESMRGRAPSLGRSRFRLTAMNGRQALDAVIKPGREIISRDEAVQIIRFISQTRREDPFGSAANEEAIEALEIEPSLLSLFCHELNERRLKIGSSRITRELVTGSSQSVLEEFYEGALADQPPALRNFVEEELVTKSGFRESMTLERARESLRQRGVQPDALEVLVRRRLLRVEERLQVSRIEIIHDLLIDVIRRSRANRERRYETGALPDSWLDKNPFRSLEPYRFEDSPIFFGRAETTRDALDRLMKNTERGCPFLLILGADGVGKTSLVQAGLVPALSRSAALGAGLWRRAAMRPGTRPHDPIAALIVAIAGDEALPELGQFAARELRSARWFGRDIAELASPVFAALEELQTAARESGELPAYGMARLVLVVDQLEELFVDTISPEQRARFIACLQAFVASGRVLVIAAIRSAFWHRLAELPQLVKLADGWGRMDLLPPTPAELVEIIRKPAQAAGLSFEVHTATGIGLDAVIAEEAALAPGVLPLLSFVLYSLYDLAVARRGDRVLTYAAYESIGGVTGAIAKRADDCVASLAPSAVATLPHVLRAMTTVTDDGVRLIARAVPIDTFKPGSPARLMVDKMIEDRLLVASSEGQATTVRPVHDALLTHWDRAKGLLEEHRRDFETRSLIERSWAQWVAAGRPAALLLRGPHLANALSLSKRWGDQLDSEKRFFVERSNRRARLAPRIMSASAIIFALVAIVAAASAFVASRARRVAERNFQLVLDSNVGLLQQVRNNLTNGRISLAVATELLTKAQATLANLDQSGTTPELTTSQIDLYLTLSDAQEQMGDLTKALAILLRARPLAERLAGDGRVGSESKRQLASVVWRIGAIRQTQGDLAGALLQYETALGIAKEAVEADPVNSSTLALLAFLYGRIGDILSAQGRFVEALNKYEAALEIDKKLASKDPNSPAAQRSLAITLNRTGDLLGFQGDLAAALSFYQQSLQTELQLAAADPENVTWQRDVATSWEMIGSAQLALARPAEALASYQAALTIRRSLAAKDPGNEQWQRDLSVSLGRLGDVLLRQGDLDQALQTYNESLAITQRLAKSDPGNASWQQALSNAYTNVGRAQMAKGVRETAVNAYQSSLAIARGVAEADPSNVQSETDVVLSLWNLAKAGDNPSGRYGEALTILDRLNAEGRLTPRQKGWIDQIKGELAKLPLTPQQ